MFAPKPIWNPEKHCLYSKCSFRCETSSRALNVMLGAIVRPRTSVWADGSLFNASRMLCGKLRADGAILIKPATAEQRTAEPVGSFSRVHRIRGTCPSSHPDHRGRARAQFANESEPEVFEDSKPTCGKFSNGPRYGSLRPIQLRVVLQHRRKHAWNNVPQVPEFRYGARTIGLEVSA